MPTLIASVVIAIIALLASVPSASAATPRGFVGLTSEEVFGSNSLRNKHLPMQRKAGVRLLRQTFDWSRIEPTPGYYDFSIHDRYVLDLARNGITVLPILFNPPEFRSSRPARGAKPGTYPPRSAAEMGAWAARLVDRYGPNGSLWSANPGVRAQPIRAWQIWNEPNLGRQYWGGKANAREYVNLLKTVGAAIKARDRKAEIVTAGLPPSFLSGAINIFKYIDQMYRAGGARAFDTMAINSYATSASNLKKLIDRVRKTMNQHGDKSAKIWITELGWCDKGKKSRFCVGTKKQAKNITESLKVIAKSRNRWRLRGFVYFSWRDGRPYPPKFDNMWGLHTGLLTLGNRRKPAYKAFTRGVKRFR